MNYKTHPIYISLKLSINIHIKFIIEFYIYILHFKVSVYEYN